MPYILRDGNGNIERASASPMIGMEMVPYV
jgi:hypothetical protein